MNIIFVVVFPVVGACGDVVCAMLLPLFISTMNWGHLLKLLKEVCVCVRVFQCLSHEKVVVV